MSGTYIDPHNGDDTTGMLEYVADQLADRHYAVIDHFLSDVEVKEILRRLQQIEEEGELKPAGIGTQDDFQLDRSIRGDWIRWIEPEASKEATQIYLDRADTVRSYLNRALYLGLRDMEMHFTVYPEGTFYLRHLDQFHTKDNRALSFICYLNFDWRAEDGGALCLYVQENGKEVCRKFLPQAGRLVVFLSDVLEHEVEVAHRERYSLTGWMLRRESGLGFL